MKGMHASKGTKKKDKGDRTCNSGVPIETLHVTQHDVISQNVADVDFDRNEQARNDLKDVDSIKIMKSSPSDLANNNGSTSKLDSISKQTQGESDDDVVLENDISTGTPSFTHMHMPVLTMNLSFAGCGFLGIYHLGVAHALAYHGRNLLLNVQRFGGASAGSLIASALAIRGPDKQVIQECADFCYDLAETVRRKKMGVLTRRMSLLEPLRVFLEHMLPEDAHIIARNRLFVSVTDVRTKKNSLCSDFESKEHLIQYLLGSSYVPYLTGTKPVRIGNKKYMDGGMTDNLPEIPDGRTILISPFSGRQHVSPRDKTGRGHSINIMGENFQMTPNNLIRGWHAFSPPKREDMERYFQAGKNDCIRFLKMEHYYEDAQNNDVISTVDNVPTTSSIDASRADHVDVTNQSEASSSPTNTTDMKGRWGDRPKK